MANSCVKFSPTSAKARREHVLDLLVDGLDDAGEIAASGPNVLELLLEESVALLELVELLERQRVDRTQQAQLAVELADAAGRRRPLGQFGLFGRLGNGRLDVEVATQGLDRVLEAQLGLGFLDLGAMCALPRLVERPLGVVAALAGGVEPGRERPHFVALAAALLDQRVVLDLDHRAVPGDERTEPLDRAQRPLDLLAMTGGSSPRLDIGRQPALGLGDPLLEELLTLVEPGVADLQLPAARGEHGRTRFELDPRLTAGSSGLGLGVLVGVERREHGLELGDAHPLDVDVGDQVDARSLAALQLGLQLAAMTEGARQALGCGREAGVVLIETTVERQLVLACRLELGPGVGQGPFGGRQGVGRGGGALTGIVESGRGCATGRRPHPPARGPQPISGRGDEHRRRMGERCLHCRVDVVDPGGAAEQSVEQARHARAAGAHVRAHRVADRRGVRVLAATTDRQDGAARGGVAQGGESASGGGVAVDDHGGQCLAERGLDRLFPTLVDLDHVEQRAQHAFDAGQPLGSGAGMRGVERQLQRLDPGVPRDADSEASFRVCVQRSNATSAERRRSSACSTSVTSGISTDSAAAQSPRKRSDSSASCVQPGCATHRPRW